MRKLQERDIVEGLEHWIVSVRLGRKSKYHLGESARGWRQRKVTHTLSVSSADPPPLHAVSLHPTLARPFCNAWWCPSIHALLPSSCLPSVLRPRLTMILSPPFLPIQTRTKHRVTSIPTTTTVCYCPLLQTQLQLPATGPATARALHLPSYLSVLQV